MNVDRDVYGRDRRVHQKLKRNIDSLDLGDDTGMWALVGVIVILFSVIVVEIVF